MVTKIANPSPDRIEAMCAEIQSNWTPRQRKLRFWMLANKGWSVPVISTKSFSAELEEAIEDS